MATASKKSRHEDKCTDCGEIIFGGNLSHHQKSRLPDHLTKDKSLTPMVCDKSGVEYKDKLGLFRCIVKFFGGDHYNLEQVISCYEKYRRYVDGPPYNEFPGAPHDAYGIVEDVFNINIQVFQSLNKNESIRLRKAMNVNRCTLSVFRQPLI